ncbi:MAG TPA: hypothetical protein VND43_04210 [Burkholderiales bacterium]|nr:hypothetical protein [Burkholderiales bacterium]
MEKNSQILHERIYEFVSNHLVSHEGQSRSLEETAMQLYQFIQSLSREHLLDTIAIFPWQEKSSEPFTLSQVISHLQGKIDALIERAIELRQTLPETESIEVYRKDASDLERIKKLVCEKDFESAYAILSELDLAVCQQIPQSIWEFLQNQRLVNKLEAADQNQITKHE